MKYYIGIDLGTTNSAICSYDGSHTRIWKSPEQNDVTPSAIYFDNRGNKYVGKRAYDSAAYNPGNAAVLFKRLMGTNTQIHIAGPDLKKTPEECTSEMLKVLFGYLPEEIRNEPELGVVVTVPAAFNQMQKEATMQAANLAGIGKVALMQEPVAAVMSVTNRHKAQDIFLIYDLGGGTLDIAIAECINKRVNLLAHGGIAMCGGRDFDRLILDQIACPWLAENFDLPDDYSVQPRFKPLIALTIWAIEKAKIELSSREDTVITLSETELRTRDASGKEIYIEIPFSRKQLNELIGGKISETLEEAHNTLSKAGLTSEDLERVVFVGGPTNYAPLQEKVCLALGVAGNTNVNPMTAVAEGASIFAESIDWSTQSRTRKKQLGELSSDSSLNLKFNYVARTPGNKTKIVAQMKNKNVQGYEFQIDSVDTGWTSGRQSLIDETFIEVNLSVQGENTFKIFVFDSSGSPISLKKDIVVIVKTAVTIEAIPASHSIGIEVLDKIGGCPMLDYIVQSGDPLPVKGKRTFKTTESLVAGSSCTLRFKLWEGDIEDPVTDNRPIGVLKISGCDFNSGIIPAGAELECEYEMLDSGNVIFNISVPSIHSTFHSDNNFYSRQEGQVDHVCSSALIVDEAKSTLIRLEKIMEVIDNPKLIQARDKLDIPLMLDLNETEVEKNQEAMERVFEARKLLGKVRKDCLKEVRQMELDQTITFFDQYLRKHAHSSEIATIENFTKMAQRSIDRNSKDFEHQLDKLKQQSFTLLYKQDWYIVSTFNGMIESPHLFIDKERFDALRIAGLECLNSDNIEKLRQVVSQLMMIQACRSSSIDDAMLNTTNILRG